MPYSYTVSTVIPASPAEIYDAWLDSIAHSEMTGGEAIMSDEVGAVISAWDGYITGRILELVPGERIVQSWRTTEFDEQIEDSIVTILLQETKDGTLLTLEHSNVPDEHKRYEEGGWQSNYFEPMVAYFDDEEENLAEPEEAPPTSGPAPAVEQVSGVRPRQASAGRRRAAQPRAPAPKSAAAAKKAKARPTKVARKASKAAAKKTSKKSSPKTSAKRRAAKTTARAGASRSRKGI